MGALMRAYDWSATPLGPPGAWPQPLRIAVRLLLNTEHPMCVWWGPEHLCFYNDAYRQSIGPERHPQSLGQPAHEVWAEIWDIIGPQVEQVMGGGATCHENQLAPITRADAREEVYWTYSYGPIDDETAPSGVGGVLVICTETTQTVLAERQAATMQEHQRRMLRQMPGFVAMLSGPDLVYTYVNDAYVAISERTDFVGRRFRDVFAEIDGQGYFEAFENAFHSGKGIVTRGMELRLHGRHDPQFVDFVLEPIRDDAGAVTGLFVGGYETTELYSGNAALRQSEARQRFLLDLGDSVRRLGDPIEIVAATTRQLGERLGASRVVYADIDEANDAASPSGGWTDGTATHLPERLRLSDYGGRLLDPLRMGRTLRIDDVRKHGATAEVLPSLEAIGVGALVSVPLVKDGRLVANVNVHQSRPRAWTDADVELIETAAERTWDAVQRARAETRLRDAEERYLALFNSIDQGFCTIEVAFDEHGAATDYRFLEISPSFERQTGIVNGEGRWMREIAPDQDQFWFDAYGRVALTGEPARLENYSTPLDRWFDVYAFRISGRRRIAVLFRDITDQKRAEAALRASEGRLAFLDRLGAETAGLAEADIVLSTTTRLLGEHLNLSVCAYADMDEDGDGFTIRGDWAASGSSSIVGHYRLADFGELAVENLSTGRPLIVNDIMKELAPEEAATFQSVGIAATICMPLVKAGRLTALMATHDSAPRVWTEAELSLVRAVTARSWAHVERVGAAADLRASEGRFRAAIDAVEGTLWTNNALGEMEGEQPGWSLLTGQSIGEYQGYGWSNSVHPDDAEPTVAAWNAAVADKRTFIFEHRVRRHDGEWRRFSIRAIPIFDASGATREWVGVHTDVTEQRAAEAALRDSEARLRDLNETLERRVIEALAERRVLADVIDGTDIFVQVADREFNWLAINRAAADEFGRIFGVRRPKAGDNMLEMLSHRPGDRAAVEAVWSRALRGEEFVEVDEFGDTSLDRRYYEMRFRTLRDPEGRAVGAYQFVSEVTDRLREQHRLQEAEEALRQSQKMEAMGSLTGGVAHDFNNLLTPIIGSLDMLVRRGVGSERERRLIDGALQSAERAKTLVQRLLAFARRQPLQPVSVDIPKLVEGMVGLIGSTLGPTIDVRLGLAPDLPAAKADANQLEMALLNLAVNARDAMPEGGELTITAKRESVRQRGHASSLKPGHYVVLSVADTGTGMDEATRQRAIEPFFSTKGVGKGTGLGLSMVHGLAAQLGGGLTIESAPGRGTSIELWLPISTAPVDSDDAVAAAPTGRVGRGVALLVDDEELVRMSTADMLIDLGFEVVEAGSAEDALRFLKNGSLPDILITDHLMPGMNGADLARQARALKPTLPVLIVSGYAEVDGLAPDLPRLVKPFRNAELAASVAALIPTATG